jgi:hypothetical protein
LVEERCNKRRKEWFLQTGSHGERQRQEPSAPSEIYSIREIVSQVRQMRKHHLKRTLGRPVVIAMAVAVLGMLAMLIVDHGPWSRPQVQTAEVANYKTTGEAARAAGAMVTPTAPKPVLEPVAPGPKPAQPANPATPRVALDSPGLTYADKPAP